MQTLYKLASVRSSLNEHVCVYFNTVVTIEPFPIGIVHRPYNSVGITVPHCDFTLSIGATFDRLEVYLKVISA